MAVLDRAKQIYASPPVGSPYSVALPNSEIPGRTAVYRHWRFQDGLLKTLDPNVSQMDIQDEEAGVNQMGDIGQYGP